MFRLEPNVIFHGTNITSGETSAAAWADYDRDGFLDLYVARENGASDWLLHNNGDATFTRETTIIPADTVEAWSVTWADFNNDGWPDLFVANRNNFFFQNNGNATFSPILTNGLLNFWAFWADYDNDGSLDALSAHADGSLALFHNNGDGTFIENLQLGTELKAVTSWNGGVNWGDYDNDGYVDLFLTASPVNFLFHNNGDGTFTRVLANSLANEIGHGAGCAWGDFDNDGFLDLFVAGGGTGSGSNQLYHNNGNSNTWLKVRLKGAASNRSGIGAKIRVQSTIRGRSLLQLREINTGGDGGLSGSLLEAHFGLGDATNIDQVRIEWPSGLIQSLTNVAPRQTLTVYEHQIAPVSPFTVSTSLLTTNHNISLSVNGLPGGMYVFESSTNLVDWVKIGVRSNATGSVEFNDSRTAGVSRRFYRVLAP